MADRPSGRGVARPTTSRTLRRVLRLRCPRCGCGALFRSFFVRAEKCRQCEWVYEREQGFWVGGAEVHMFASYGVSVVLFMPLLFVFGPTPAVQAGVVAGHVVCSLLLFRFSRAAFIGLDYFLDPGAPESDDDGGGAGVPVKPVPRSPRSTTASPRRLPALAGGRAPARTARPLS
ncbi:MAG: DUF983 domain-containing protein [Planctomycetota bacterium]|jgi:uncharacterized protein (DUF983 family)